jgi:hypothetical protein
MTTLLQSVTWQYNAYYRPELFDKVIEVEGVSALVKQEPDKTIVAFPGSRDLEDWLRDAAALIPFTHPILGIIPYGFAIGADAMFDALRPVYQEGKRVHYIMHSLGCPHGLYQAAFFVSKGFSPCLPSDMTIHGFEPPRSGTQTLKDWLAPIPNITLTRNSDPEGDTDIVLDMPSWAMHPRDLTQIGSEPITGNIIIDKEIHAIQSVMVSCELLEAQDAQ